MAVCNNCTSGDEIFFLLRNIYWEILYIHRCILQDLADDVWDRSFYIHTGTFLHQILCWAHRKWGAVCFCTCTDMMPCLILCESHSLRAAHLLCRHTDRFLHPALCWAHKYGILQTCQNLQGEKRNQNHAVPSICKFDYSRCGFFGQVLFAT